MSNFGVIVKKYYEIVGYVLLTILLFGACFVTAFVWIATVYAVLFAVLLRRETKLVGLLLYLNCFRALFYYQKFLGIALNIFLVNFLIVMLLGQYLFRLIKREQKLNWKTLIPIGLFLIYVALPFHECNCCDFFATVSFYVLVYVIFESRKQIDFRYITRIFVLGIVVSCIFALFGSVSPLLKGRINVVDYKGSFRFQGLSSHPNTLSILVMLAICAMLILKYKNKISLAELLLTFVPMFIFGYLTISRSFIVIVIAGIIVFTACYFLQHKTKALALLGILLVIMCAIGGVFFNTTKIYHQRIVENSMMATENLRTSVESSELVNLEVASVNDFFDEQSAEWQQDVYDGKIHFDPGRSGLADLYIRDWQSSPQTIWLGRGISRPYIGQISAHNLFVQELWKHGIVGYFFYAAIILCSVNWKKKQHIRCFLPALVILIPYFLVTMIEQCLWDYLSLIMIFGAFSCLDEPSTKPESGVEEDLVAKGNP